MGSSGKRIPANSQASLVSKVMMNKRPFFKQGKGEASDLLVLVHTMCIHTQTLRGTHTHTGTHRHMNTHIYTQGAHTHTHRHTYIQAHTDTCPHTCTQVCTYTLTRTHIQFFKSSIIFLSKRSGLLERLTNPEDPTRPS